MNNELYWIVDLLFASMVFITKFKNRDVVHNVAERRNAFEALTSWVIFFCIQDSFWGLCSCGIADDRIFFLSSIIFHISTVFLSLMWLRYILTYLNAAKRIKIVSLTLAWLMIIFQFTLLSVNIFNHSLFYIADGIYRVTYLRSLLFVNSYIIFLTVGILTLYKALNFTIRRKKAKYYTVFIFSLAPIIAGFCQYKFTYAPFHTIGYFTGVFLIYIFIISEEHKQYIKARIEKDRLEHQIQIKQQMNIAMTDELSGIKNRRAYMAAVDYYEDNPLEDNFVYVLADINGLKHVNDTKGHAAGDELIVGAARALKETLGRFGFVYRLGGDEFAAILHISEKELIQVKNDLCRRISAFKGKYVSSISMSIGTVVKSAHDNLELKEIISLADEQMYQQKREYYLNRGIDRKGQYYAYNALCNTYQNILKLDLTKDSFRVIFSKNADKSIIGKCQSPISDWFDSMIESNCIQHSDVDVLKNQCNLAAFKDVFSDGTKDCMIYYRRKYPDHKNDGPSSSGTTLISTDRYDRTVLEIVPAEDYTQDNKTLYIFEKRIERN